MKRTPALALGFLAALAVAASPAISSASVTRSPHAMHTSASVVTTAHPLHTGVQPRLHAHHAHARHAHHARPELRAAAAAHAYAAHSAPAPQPQRRRPVHTHAMLPHAGVKLHRTERGGGAPYALGQASLSLGLWTSGDPMPVSRNELISDPSSGILKGRSPPRGVPLSATTAPSFARPPASAASSRATADLLRTCRSVPALLRNTNSDPRPVEACLRSGASAPGSPALPIRPGHGSARIACGAPALTVRAFEHGELPFRITPDRASEGRTAGSLLPSWRCFA
jgi:hypothetical protein